MTEAGGGTPPAPAGYVPPSLPGQAAGSATGLVRARLVIVSGPSGAVSGLFLYAPGTRPGPGNPPVVAVTNQAADPFGNSVLPSDSPGAAADLIVFGAGGSYAQLAPSSGLASLILGTGDASEVTPAAVNAQVFGTGGLRQLLTQLIGPSFSGGLTSALSMLSQSADGGVTNPAITNFTLAGTLVLQLLGISTGHATAQVSVPSGIQLSVAAGGGPFIPGEGFHTISTAAGMTGSIRVKKLPWSGIWMDVDVQLTGSAGGTFTFGSLPDASYYPALDRQFPLMHTGVPTALSGSARVHVPTSGAVEIITPSYTASGQFLMGSIMYPVN